MVTVIWLFFAASTCPLRQFRCLVYLTDQLTILVNYVLNTRAVCRVEIHMLGKLSGIFKFLHFFFLVFVIA